MPFTLAVGPYAEGRLRVLSFHGREVVSRPFRFDVMVAVAGAEAPDLASTLLGQPAALTLAVPGGEPRTLRGIVSAVEAQGRHAPPARHAAALAARQAQDEPRLPGSKRAPITAAVLDDAGVPCRKALVEEHPARTYCVQYDETDLAFVSRLCEEEGIFYVFEHAAEETVVFGDGAHAYQPIAGDAELANRYEHGEAGLVPEEHHVGRFALRRAVRSGAVLQRDYDFRRPLLDLRAEAKPSSAPPARDRVQRGSKPSSSAPTTTTGRTSGPTSTPAARACAWSSFAAARPWPRGQARAGGSRRASRSISWTMGSTRSTEATWSCAWSTRAGRPRPRGGASRCTRTGSSACPRPWPALRPKRPRRALQQVTETALVVGPEGEEIYTDEHGRVKVQFPWDLEGKNDEHSSCWVRVAQVWGRRGLGVPVRPAGPGWRWW